MTKARDYKVLKVWQKGIDITDEICTITDRFPEHKLYGLSGQIRKVSVSVPPKITEELNHESRMLASLINKLCEKGKTSDD